MYNLNIALENLKKEIAKYVETQELSQKEIALLQNHIEEKLNVTFQTLIAEKTIGDTFKEIFK